MTRALIAEDEPLLAAALQAELHKLWPGLQITAVARNGVEALRQIQADPPDVAFLDIRMPGMTGLEVAQTIAEDWESDRPPPLVVFVTAYDQFAVSAFEHAAADYLLKPVQPARLATALERVKARLQARMAAPGGHSVDELVAQLRTLLTPEASRHGHTAGAPDGPLRVIRAGVGDTVRLIPIESVLLLQAADKYVNVLTAEHESLIREPLKDLLPRLDPSRFVQIHRGAVVNLAFVESAVRDDTGKVTLRLRGRSERPVVSRLYVHLFRAM
jgi:DNA-binding LytR/AlgR family response regulator